MLRIADQAASGLTKFSMLQLVTSLVECAAAASKPLDLDYEHGERYAWEIQLRIG